MRKYDDVFDLITSEISAYETVPIVILGVWNWNMFNHVKLSTLYKNFVYGDGQHDDRPFDNITLPNLRLQYRTEGFDVKDIAVYINHSKAYFKSMLVRKFHEQWALEQGLNTFIDELVESYADYGGTLIKQVKGARPEVVDLKTIAFADQTNLLGGPLGIRHHFSPDELMEKEKDGWGEEKNGATATIQELIDLSLEEKKDGQWTNKTPGKYIEVYEVHGMFPKSWIGGSSNKYTRQMHIVGFYTNETWEQKYVILYKKEVKQRFKVLLRDPVKGKALGLGGAEELFEPQVWNNYDVIRMKELLDAVSKVILKTTDPAVAARTRIKDMDNLEILTLLEGTDIGQVDTFPRSFALFDREMQRNESRARQISGATEALQGENPPSGQPFRSTREIIIQGQAQHEYRKGKIAEFLTEVYRDWILPDMEVEIVKEKEFLAEFSWKEFTKVLDDVTENAKAKIKKDMVADGKLPYEDEARLEAEAQRRVFQRYGRTLPLGILKDEMKGLPKAVKISIAGKSRLAELTDKLSAVLQQVFSTFNPNTGTFAVFDDPRMADWFNQILEYSNLDPVDLGEQPALPVNKLNARIPQPERTASVGAA